MKTLSYTPSRLAPYVNWAYFFYAWGISARFTPSPHIVSCTACTAAWIASQPNEKRAAAVAALDLMKQAQTMLSQLEAEGLEVLARFALLPCRSKGEDLVFEDTWNLPLLRQQKKDGVCLCLSDFVLPVGYDGGDGVNDRVGIYATTCKESEPHEADMLRQTVLDRLCEAAAELMHQEVRKHYWGYAPDEHLSMEDLHAERFQGIRPAIGYPCLPDQRVIFLLSRHLNFQEIGIKLTEIGAMLPHASTCGLLLAHPEAHYFTVGEVSKEQWADYEKRLLKELSFKG